ncbi:hypothetical protein NXW80_14665 [Bacteroides fragilis]|nr:hypothetical protein [Bacteroides fragilis]
MLKINTTSKYAEFKSDTKSDLYPLNEISYTVENESETVSFYNRFYNKIMTEQISNIQVNDVPVNRDNIQDLLSVLFAANEGGGGGTVDLSNYYTKPEVDTKIDTKVDKVEGKQLSTEDYTTEEKTKLAGLENYDDTIVKADIASNTAAIEAEVERATNAESELNTKIPTVQTGNIGTNKNYIYSIYNDTVYSVLSSVGFVGNEADVTVFQAKWGGGTTQSKLNAATVSKSGVMSSADKTKLDSLSNYDDTTVKDDIVANKTAIEAEVVRAKAAEKVNADAISALDTAYKTADATLDTKIDAEVTRATNAESELNTKIETKVDKVSGKQLSTEDYTTAEKSKLASLSNYDDSELRTLIETKADKDKYEKVEGKDYSSFTTFNIDSKIKYQYVDMNEANTNTVQLYLISIPSDEISDFHVLVKGNSTKSVEVKAGGYNIAWKETPDEIVNGVFYEFIFTIFKTQNKVFAGYIKYE